MAGVGSAAGVLVLEGCAKGAPGADATSPVNSPALAGTGTSPSLPKAAVALPVVGVSSTALSADGGWMYQGSRPRPPPETEACCVLKGLGVAVRMSMVPKSTTPRALRKPELVPIESALHGHQIFADERP